MAKYDFIEHYAGPHGPHLNCLTQYTRTRDETKRGGVSIHVRDGGVKCNTCGSPSRSVLLRKIAAITAHLERHPFATHRGHLEKLQSQLRAA